MARESSDREPSDREPISYARAARLAEYIVRDIAQQIEGAIHALGDKNLVRAKLDARRIKSPRSLARKARQRGWTFDQAVSQAPDFVGFRVVCHNLQDARRAADLLEISLRVAGLKVERQDYEKNPKPSGYRAIHLMFRISVTLGTAAAELGWEIQIRSLLENAWAELPRADIYTEQVPPPVERQMTTVSRQLARNVPRLIYAFRHGHCLHFSGCLR
jgi:putative GTP pyrophosphokinase